jgi:hypothetical protein
MEQTSWIYCVTKEAADETARAMQVAGWSVEVATEPEPDGWLVKAYLSDAEGDDLWAVGRMKTFRH